MKPLSTTQKLTTVSSKSMAEPMTSALLRVLFEKLVSETSNSIARYKGIGAEIEKCQDSLKLIQGVLTDAYQKEKTSQAVKVWLNDLQHLAYDIDDILDGWATDAMSREFTHESEAFTSNVRKLIPSCCTNFSPSIKMHDKLDRINVKLERLVKQRDDFGLRVEGETKPENNNRRLQTSIVDPSSIIGREAEKEALVKQLLEDGPCDQKFSIVPIVGMGGVGKTTLARLSYNEKQVKDHFQLKAWVCVSDEFDGFGISKVIFQSMAGVNKEFEDLNLLQEALVNHVRGNRFLLVLDDVWSESHEDWETLVRPFYTCSPGSKIIITTRKDNLLKNLGYNPLNKQLEKLSYDDVLQELRFYNCPNLKKVSLHPQHLSSLQHLTFHHCPKMKDLPELLLPSLLRLRIWGDCPNLKERCSINGIYWPLISYIPFISTSSWTRT